MSERKYTNYALVPTGAFLALRIETTDDNGCVVDTHYITPYINEDKEFMFLASNDFYKTWPDDAESCFMHSYKFNCFSLIAMDMKDIARIIVERLFDESMKYMAEGPMSSMTLPAIPTAYKERLINTIIHGMEGRPSMDTEHVNEPTSGTVAESV